MYSYENTAVTTKQFDSTVKQAYRLTVGGTGGYAEFSDAGVYIISIMNKKVIPLHESTIVSSISIEDGILTINWTQSAFHAVLLERLL